MHAERRVPKRAPCFTTRGIGFFLRYDDQVRDLAALGQQVRLQGGLNDDVDSGVFAALKEGRALATDTLFGRRPPH